MVTSQFLQNPYGSFTGSLSAPTGNYGGTSLPGPGLPYNLNTGDDLDKIEGRTGFATQNATNVLDVRNPLSAALTSFQNQANRIPGMAPSLRTNFQGASAYNRGLQNGIDYFGRLGMAEGTQNINLQRDTANRQLAQNLLRTPGNEGLLSVLQNQNLMRSQLATQPLISEAQRGTADRVSKQVELNNAMNQLYNQAQLAQYQSKIAGLQPGQNLLEILSGLQGMQRGTTSQEAQVGARNYK